MIQTFSYDASRKTQTPWMYACECPLMLCSLVACEVAITKRHPYMSDQG